MENTHLLGKYRNFGLFYDEDKDVFYSDLSDKFELKKEPVRSSLSALKKVIDEYIKSNTTFKPFEALYCSISYENRGKKRIPSGIPGWIKIIGVKKDGGLMIEKIELGKVVKGQLNENSYEDSRQGLFENSTFNHMLAVEVSTLELEIANLRKEIENKLTKFKPLDLSFIKDFKK